MLNDFYSKKKVLVTGHTGFKGSWLVRMLHILGAEVYGYSLEPPTDPNLYDIIECESIMAGSCIGDISDFTKLFDFYSDVSPDIVFHLAAQPIVREGYRNPRNTYQSNVMGTVNVLECARMHDSARSIVNVTTDKVYDNDDTERYYSEGDRLDGYDPYSNSKSCSELVTHSYKRSFFNNTKCAISTARAGNVIGGGDFAQDRIIPDCIRSAIKGEDIIVRNPNSVRPFEHVLEPLYAYVKIASSQYNDLSISGSYNIGPDGEDCVTVEKLVTLFCDLWGENIKWRTNNLNGPHESNYLKLDNNLLKNTFGIKPLWHISDAVLKVVDWTKAWQAQDDVVKCTNLQIKDYLSKRGINV